VNSVCRLLQLLADFVTGASPVRSLDPGLLIAHLATIPGGATDYDDDAGDIIRKF